MLLYKIRFWQEDEIQDAELYAKGKFKPTLKNGKLVLSLGDRIGFDTYFNSFAPNSWKKYTRLSSLDLEINGKGRFRVRILGGNRKGSDIRFKVVAEEEVKDRFLAEMRLEDLDYELLYPEVESLEEGCEIHGGSYSSRDEKTDLRLSIVFCTFRREDFIDKNILNLRRGILEDDHSPLRDHLRISVVDNGNTLKNRDIDNFLEVFPNKNLGGSGGFARGILESLKDSRFTHILLLDDDIRFSVTSLEILHSFLSFLREEFERHFIGGSLIDLALPYLQYERNAVWNGISTKLNGSGLDLRKTECLFGGDAEASEGAYAGWWFCCIPTRVVKELGLPLPFFLKGDDVEYSLRNGSKLISLNGVGAWHEAFPKRVRKWNYYYQIRNYFILSVLRIRRYDRSDFLRFSLFRLFKNLIWRNELALKYTRKALEDILNGALPTSGSEAESLQKSVLELQADGTGLGRLGWDCMSLTFRIWKEFPLICEEIRRNSLEFPSVQFWRKYLSLG
ncbi:glycosyltransferase family 2 protein [Leptospira fletcheri]|uniref:Glycosyltransferase family 2 protein n=1 Tax=Leptospira fletcheri TaxID=2484981 RepID=A0A4R9GDL2_9LEPT|nr:glycosyltransferase [Leptospira fletcheri]TGK09936.1 glycosyltransferase family 2 protein [Leptospira fletcheri]